MGYSHVKILDGVLTCSSKDSDCRSSVVKGRYERAKKFCVHLHTYIHIYFIWCLIHRTSTLFQINLQLTIFSMLSSAPEVTVRNKPPALALLVQLILFPVPHQLHLYCYSRWKPWNWTRAGSSLTISSPLHFFMESMLEMPLCRLLYCTQRLLVVGYADTVWRIKLSILVAKGRLTWLLLHGHIRKWKSE